MPTNKELEIRLKAVEDKVSALETASQTMTVTVPEVRAEDSTGVPSDFRQVVNEVLNDKFAIHVVPQGHDASFELTIIVPEVYSNAPAEQKKDDRRIKIIKYADGSQGVREYAELVYKNLGAETQARISAER